MGIRPLAGLELVRRAIGVTPPQVYPNLFLSFKQMRDQQYIKRPIVVFPQCARTNGRGVLNFPLPLQ